MKSHPEEKVGGGLGLGELLKIVGFPYNISAMAGASDFKFGKPQEVVKAHHKSHAEEGWTWPYARGAPQNLGVSLQYLHNG